MSEIAARMDAVAAPAKTAPARPLVGEAQVAGLLIAGVAAVLVLMIALPLWALVS